MTVLSLVATCLGIFLSVLNLVVFLKEKDRSHVRTAVLIVTLGAVLLGLVTLPRFAPRAASRLARMLPANPVTELWLGQTAPSPAASGSLAGSFRPEWRYNLFGGISGLKLTFQFASTADVPESVLSYRLSVGGQAYERVLPQPVLVAPKSTAQAEVEADGEILEAFLRRMDAEQPGPVSIEWRSAEGIGFSANVAKF